MRIALAQMDPVAGDLEGNLATILAFCDLASAAGAKMVVFPPHALDGDLSATVSYSPGFLHRTEEILNRLAKATRVPVVLGCVCQDPDDSHLARLMACFVSNGDVVRGALDQVGAALSFKYAGLRFEVAYARQNHPFKTMPDCLLLLDEAVFFGQDTLDSFAQTLEEDKAYASQRKGVIARINLVGGFDETVCRGASYALSPAGELLCACTDFAPDLVYFEVGGKARKQTSDMAMPSRIGAPIHQQGDTLDASLWRAIVRSTRDFVLGNGFSDCLLGLSGGIDSAVVATLAADAIGPEHVHVLLMPSPYSSQGSIDDSLALVENLGLDATTVPITSVYESCRDALARVCGGQVTGITDENLQARIRTLFLMAVSNTYNWMLLNTGNKSEAAMGFSTLYGDTAGSFAPLGDLYKTQVYELARFRNALSPVIPQEILEKPPSAELHPDQRDDDRLPAYEELDSVLFAHVEQGMGRQQLIDAGFDSLLVDRVVPQVARYEFKRRQEPLGPVVSALAFSERGWPVTNRFVDNGSLDE